MILVPGRSILASWCLSVKLYWNPGQSWIACVFLLPTSMRFHPMFCRYLSNKWCTFHALSLWLTHSYIFNLSLFPPPPPPEYMHTKDNLNLWMWLSDWWQLRPYLRDTFTAFTALPFRGHMLNILYVHLAIWIPTDLRYLTIGLTLLEFWLLWPISKLLSYDFQVHVYPVISTESLFMVMLLNVF